MTTINGGIDEKLFNYIIETNSKAPFYVALGVQTRYLGPGVAKMGVLTQKMHANPLGIIHGGLVSTLADAAMGNAIRASGRMGVTADYNVSFLAAAPIGEDLEAEGEVVKQGKNLIFVKAVVRSGEKLIATSQGTFFVLGEMKIE